MMIKTSITHPSNPNKYLLAQRAKLMADLQELNDLPPHQLRRRYYQIHPELRYVCRVLATSEKFHNKNNSTNNLQEIKHGY